MSENNNLEREFSKRVLVKRTARVVMTDTVRVLKEIRIEHNYSMRELGQKMGKSDSYVSQIENGRMDAPAGESLEKYLAVFENISIKTFQERVRRYRVERGPGYRDELLDIIKRASDTQVKHMLLLAKTLLATHINW